MAIKQKPVFRIRRANSGQYHFELDGKHRERLLYGFPQPSVKHVINDVKRVRRASAEPRRFQLRKLNNKVFLLITDRVGRGIAVSEYFKSKKQLAKAVKQIRKAINTASKKILKGYDNVYLDECPEIEAELQQAFRILDRNVMSQQLVNLIGVFSAEVVTQALGNIVTVGARDAPKAVGAAALLAFPPISVEQAAASSESVSTRVAAAYALTAYPDTFAREQVLINLLADPHTDVAYRSTVSAGSMLSHNVRGILTDMSTSHASSYVRQEADRIVAG